MGDDMISMSDFNSVIFTDEIEIEENHQTGHKLTIHFNGLYFDLAHAAPLKIDFEPIVQSFGKNGFHAKDFFNEKSEHNYPLLRTLTDLIIKHKLLWLNFAFPEAAMNDPRLTPFFSMPFTEMTFQKDNYKAVAFYFYIHSINYYQEKFKVFRPKIRIYTDRDQYLKKYEFLYHQGSVLKNLELIIASRGSSEPFLYLADFVGYIFRRVSTKLCRDFSNIEAITTTDQLTKECLKSLMKINQAGLFQYLDLWEIMPTERPNDKEGKSSDAAI